MISSQPFRYFLVACTLAWMAGAGGHAIASAQEAPTLSPLAGRENAHLRFARPRAARQGISKSPWWSISVRLSHEFAQAIGRLFDSHHTHAAASGRESRWSIPSIPPGHAKKFSFSPEKPLNVYTGKRHAAAEALRGRQARRSAQTTIPMSCATRRAIRLRVPAAGEDAGKRASARSRQPERGEHAVHPEIFSLAGSKV